MIQYKFILKYFNYLAVTGTAKIGSILTENPFSIACNINRTLMVLFK